MEPRELDHKEQSSTALFIKVGVVVLSIILMIGFGIKIFPKAITVSNTGSRRDLPIYCVNTDEKKVALSFDAAWGNEDTRNILAILAKHHVKVTFFMTGGWVEKYPDDVKAIAKAGHDLGNHSENHKQMSQLSKEQCADEIMKVHNRVKDLTGIKMNLFRAPYGDYNNTLVGTARECGYYTIQWDVDVYATTLKQGNTRILGVLRESRVVFMI
jgi:Predicted xylanase/chitin deacetylase